MFVLASLTVLLLPKSLHLFHVTSLPKVTEWICIKITTGYTSVSFSSGGWKISPWRYIIPTDYGIPWVLWR